MIAKCVRLNFQWAELIVKGKQSIVHFTREFHRQSLRHCNFTLSRNIKHNIVGHYMVTLLFPRVDEKNVWPPDFFDIGGINTDFIRGHEIEKLGKLKSTKILRKTENATPGLYYRHLAFDRGLLLVENLSRFVLNWSLGLQDLEFVTSKS